MAEYAQTWRRELRIHELVEIAKKEIALGTEISQIYQILDDVIYAKWRSIPTTRRAYIESVKKDLANQYTIVV
ncbi:MAG: hypothetical protein OEL77_06915 [Nitrosopumilus sp.]|nr:hypothetical protein [Nitrosopumilus sp.]MDH3385726.1 hypothetical protein [Nitrosopumilus sp.]